MGRLPKYGPKNPGKRFLAKNKAVTPAVKQQIKRTINRAIETKVFPSFSGNVSGLSSGSILSLCNVPNNVGYTQRVGQVISPIRLKMRMNFASNSGIASDAYNRFRVILFRWKEDDSSNTPDLSDVLDVGPGTSANPVDYQYNTQNKAEYTILSDKVYQLHPMYSFTSTGAISTVIAQYDNRTIIINRAMTGQIHFNGDQTTGQNKIFILLLTDSSTTPHPIFNYTANLYYKDA